MARSPVPILPFLATFGWLATTGLAQVDSKADVFDDTFEPETVGSPASQWSGAETVQNGAATPDGTQYLELVRAGGNVNTATPAFGPGLGPRLVFECLARKEAAVGNSLFRLRNGGTSVVQIRFNATDIQYQNNAAWINAQPYVAGVWYRLRVEFDFAAVGADQYAFYVDNALIAAGITSSGAVDANQIDTIFLLLASADHTFRADDVEVYTQKKWIGATDTDWFTATNWAPNGVPVAADQVRVTDQSLEVGFPVVTDDGTVVTIAELGLDDQNYGPTAGNTIDLAGRFDAFNVTGNVLVDSGAVALCNTVDPATISGNLSVAGTFDADGGTTVAVTGTLSLEGGGLVFGGPGDSNVVTAGAFTQSGGTLTMEDPGDLFDVNGAFTVTAGSLGGGFAGDVRVSGDLQVTGGSWDMPQPGTAFSFPKITLDGATAASVQVNGGTNRIGTLNLTKSPTTTAVTLNGATRAWYVTTGSRLSIAAFTLAVDDDFRLKDGGDLVMSNASGVLDVADRFEFNQTSTSITTSGIAAGTIEVGGAFDVETAAGTQNFQPAGGTVVLDGAAAQLVRFDSTSDRFAGLTVSGPDVRLESAFSSTLEVQAEFTVSLASQFTLLSGQVLRLSRWIGIFPPQTHTIAGTLVLQAGNGTTPTRVRLGDHQQLVVDGTIQVSDPGGGFTFPGNRYVHFTRDAAGGYSIWLRDGSSVSLEFVKFEYLYGRGDSDEIDETSVQSGLAFTGDQSGITKFTALWFDNAQGGGAPGNNRYPRYLYLLVDDGDNLTGLGDLTRFSKIRFQNSGGLADLHNSEKIAAGEVVRFRNCAGDVSVFGEPFDMDGFLDDNVTPDPDPRNTGEADIVFFTSPTAVDLADLRATGFEGAVLVEWETGQEVDNLGFHVYRSVLSGSGFARVDPALILGLGDSLTGGRYAFADRDVVTGQRYWYLLEDVDVRGERTLHGPVSAASIPGGAPLEIDSSSYVSVSPSGSSPPPAPEESPTPSGTRTGSAPPADLVLGTDLQAAGIRLLSYDDSGAVLEIVPPAPLLTPELRSGRLETRLSMSGYSELRVPGLPEIPEKTILLVTPGIAGASWRLLAGLDRAPFEADLVRFSPAAAPPATGTAPGAPDAERFLFEVLGELRRELVDRVVADRRELLAARRAARDRLLGRAPRGEGRAGTGGGPPPVTGPFPGTPIELGSLLEGAGRQLLPISIRPVQAALRRVTVHRRLVVRIDFLGTAPVPPSSPDEDVEETRFRLANDGRVFKVHVRADGLFRLDREALLRAGFDVEADPRNFRLYHLGREVAIRVDGQIDGSFDPGDTILFHGLRNPWRTADNPEATRYTDENVYWLAAGSERGRRMDEVWVRPAGLEEVPDVPAAIHLESNALYYPRLADGEGRDHWFRPERLYEAAGAGRPTRVLAIPCPIWDLSPLPHTARLTVALAGVTDFAADPDHHVVVRVGGQLVGEARWDGRRAHQATFEFPSSVLAGVPGTIELELPADVSGVPADSVLVNFVELEVRRRPVARDDVLDLATDRTGEILATGFGSARVLGLDVSRPGEPRWLRGLESSGGTVRFDGQPGRYLLVGDESALEPESIERNRPSSWNAPGQRADWVAIAHPSLLGALQPLADHRASQGLATQVIDVADLYDEFTGGIPDPSAIREFLRRASRVWDAPGPRWVLLAGDGSFDPHGYLWPGSDLLPAPLVQLEELHSASDVWYAAIAGDDDLPDLAIGRIAAATPAALSAAIAKILDHERGAAGDWRRRLALAADDDDQAFDFTLANHLLAAEVGAPWEAEEISLGELGPAEARRRVLAAFDEGRFVVGYMGHGSTVAWANEGILHARDVPGLAPGDRHGLVTAMGCMTGMYHLPNLECLGEALVETPERGAAAFWGATTLAPAQPQERALRALLPRLLAANRTLGEAILEVQAEIWAGGPADRDLVRGWVLLGDPASRLGWDR